MTHQWKLLSTLCAFSLILSACESKTAWLKASYPDTNWDKSIIDLNEVDAFGTKYSSQIHYQPHFAPVSEVTGFKDNEPMITVNLKGEQRAYPFRYIYYGACRDEIKGEPLLVTHCPSCSSSTVFDPRLDGKELLFQGPGFLRHGDVMMMDKETQSLWGKIDGKAVVGDLAGEQLRIVPSRLESFKSFKDRAPDGKIMLQPISRHASSFGGAPDPVRRDQWLSFSSYRYGSHSGADNAELPGLFRRDRYDPKKEGISGTQRILIIHEIQNEQAWTTDYIREKRYIEYGDIEITWKPGMAAWLDAGGNYETKDDFGNFVVQRVLDDGTRVDLSYDTPYMAVYRQFNPNTPIIK